MKKLDNRREAMELRRIVMEHETKKIRKEEIITILIGVIGVTLLSVLWVIIATLLAQNVAIAAMIPVLIYLQHIFHTAIDPTIQRR